MPLIPWKDNYSVNIAAIDEQHKKLIAMINQLHESMSQGQGKVVLGDLLNDLIAYTASHFAAEERLMQEHDYPEYIAHKEKHEKMKAKVLALQSDYKQGKIALTLDVSKFLQDWLDKHILGTDKKYAPFLKERGVH